MIEANGVQLGLSDEKVVENYEIFEKTLFENCLSRAQELRLMLEKLGERLCLCPASGQLDFHSAWPGGLVDHSIRVLRKAKQLKPALAPDVSLDSLTIAAFFHDFGKLGDDVDDYYLPQTSQWHREKRGETYSINRSMTYMTVPLRGLWLLQHHDVKLTKDETLAIYLNDGQYIAENKPYGMKEPPLADLIHTADLWATKFEKTAYLAAVNGSTSG